MRPLELRLRNFRSYFGEDTVFDFRNRGLVGVVGPIGSGKSSLLDAIAFALFGRTPTVAATTKSLIHQRADGATVSLRFTVEGEVWEVTRALRRKGQSVHGLHRLEADEPDAGKAETIVLEGEVNEKIVELLGLEYDGFFRSIMLAQGQFAEFLRSRPAERDKVLKGVFGHDRIDVMRSMAKDRAVAEATKVETLTVRLEAADALADRIVSSKETLAALEAQLEVLKKAEAKFIDHAERTAATERVIAHAEGRLDELAPLAVRIPAPGEVGEVVKVAENAAATRERLGSALAEAQKALADADKAHAALVPAEMRKTIDEAVRLETTTHQLDNQLAGLQRQLESSAVTTAKLEKQLEAARQERDDAHSTSAATQQELEAALAAQAEALAALHAAQHGDMAATLRTSLVAGDTCPVCEQTVSTLPADDAGGATSRAENVVAAAEGKVARARQSAESIGLTVAKAGAAVAGAEAEIKSAVAEAKASEKAADRVAAELAGLQKQLETLLSGRSAEELRRDLDESENAAAEARKRVDVARGEHDEAIFSSQAADKELGALRLTIAELSAKLAVDVDALEEPAQVGAALDRLRQAWKSETETLTTAKHAAEQERSEIAAAVRELRRELEIDGDFATHLAEVAATAEVRRQQIGADEVELAQSGEVREARTAADLRRQTYESLAGELTDSKFVRYLLDEEKRDLANLGSEHFERLSSGRYRFSTDGEFKVVDLTSADAIRKADSLSGGETFLASLALALALAEMVARTGGRLDAFFLDEGFGSLDPEHLDLAMEGIEQLAAGATDRLVLVVSHVPDMRHRLEDLIELDRNPVTGDTVVVHG